MKLSLSLSNPDFLKLLLFIGFVYVLIGIAIDSFFVMIGELTIGVAVTLWVLQHSKSLGLK
jgi:hypothetical protein